ncbi:unnamed protein product [Rotaria sp. Silwood1]|nr:unnamed protein product [Rotaria sp. Silwood1]CAF1613878.1 unnamed protein product [Rotaria sp. Silwood1]CAF3691505.1 unnamed protein product [Rotaria sp. Silwood1]CAF3740481.1 unnamed protein product [Rotaria sp. Silwood1]CAF3808877.1 unnamed protein product [Rotaria sp. Silwood1]
MITGKHKISFLQRTKKITKQRHSSHNNMRRLSIDNFKSLLTILPNYIKMFKKIFVRRLSNSIPNQSAMIRQLLTNTAMFHFVRHRVQLVCNFSVLKIEEDYWNYVADVAMPTVRWLSQTSKNITHRNFINWDYPRTEYNIRHRQRIIDNKLKQVEANLKIHLQQRPHCEEQGNATSFDQTMNMIDEALTILLMKDLEKYVEYFQHKKLILNFDLNEVYLVKSFYDCNPTEEQVLNNT